VVASFCSFESLVAFCGLLKAVYFAPLLSSVGDVSQGPTLFMLISMFFQHPTFYISIFCRLSETLCDSMQWML